MISNDQTCQVYRELLVVVFVFSFFFFTGGLWAMTLWVLTTPSTCPIRSNALKTMPKDIKGKHI